jgi:hypothetical protein
LASITPENTNIVSLSETFESTFIPYGCCYAGTEWAFVVRGDFEYEFEKPFKISHVLTRRSSRRFDGKKYVDRCYESLLKDPEKQSETHEEYLEAVESQDPDVQIGYTHLVVAWDFSSSDPYISFLTIEAFGTTEDYWKAALSQGELREDKCAHIFTVDHSENLKTSAKGRQYLASYKFKNWEVKSITEEEKQAILAQSQKQQKQIENFLKR